LFAQTLEELKRISAEENLELKAQYKIFEAQLESVNQAKAWQDPNLSSGYFISPIETRVGPQVARFSLSQMFPWFGTLKTKGNIAALIAEAEFQKFQDKKLQLYLKVAEQYYDLSALEHQKVLEVEHLSILNNLKSMVQSYYENNKAQLIDIYRVELDIDRQKNTIKVLENQKAVYLAKLNQLLNRPLSQTVLIENPKQILENVEMLTNDNIAENHPKIESLKILKASAKANKTLADKQTMPQFGLGIDYAIIQDRNVQNADSGQDAIMPMLSMSLPIFGKKNKSNKKVASLKEESMTIALENEVQSLNTELDIATYKREELKDFLALYDKQLIDLNDMMSLTASALENAQIDIEDILELQKERLLIEKQRVKTLTSLQKNYEFINYLTLNQ
jgi:outer membrane protein TolC